MPASKAPEETYSELLHVRVLPKIKRAVDSYIKGEKEKREKPYNYPQFLREAIEEKLKGYGTLEELFSSEIGKEILEKIQCISPEDFHDLVAVEINMYEIFSEIYRSIKDPESEIHISDEKIKKVMQKMNKLEEKRREREEERLIQFIEEDEKVQGILVKKFIKTLKSLPNDTREEVFKTLNEV